MLLLAGLLLALQDGAVVTAGEAAISRPDSSTTLIQQTSDKAVLEWREFNVAAGERVLFVQPAASSIALNRVLGSDPSKIFGSIEANGILFLLNPNGIVFGADATVATGGFVATTLSLLDGDFLAGRYLFTSGDAPLGAVLNHGRIVGERFAVLAGPFVENSGALLSPGGRVLLLGAGEVVLQIEGDSLFSYSMGGASTGGVLLELSEPARAVVNTAGLFEAASVETLPDGTVRLAGVGGLAINRGLLGSRELSLIDSVQAMALLPDSILQTDGGRIEVRARGNALLGGQFSSTGERASILIDPPTLTVVPAGSPVGVNQISEVTISTMSGSGDVELEADNTLQFQAVGGYTYFAAGTAPIAPGATLTLRTLLNATVSQTTSTGLFWIASDTVAVPDGTLVLEHRGARVGGMDVGALVVTGDNPILLEGSIAASGDVTVTSTDIVLGGALTAGGTVTFTATGSGTLSSFFAGQGGDRLGIRAAISADEIFLQAVELGGSLRDNVTIDASLTSTTGNIELRAGDSVLIRAGTVDSAADLLLYASGFDGATLDVDNIGAVTQSGGTATAAGLVMAVAERGINLGRSGTLMAGDFTAKNQGVGGSSSPSGSILVRNTGDMTIVGDGVVNAGGAVTVETASNLTVSAPVQATGAVTLAALSPGDVSIAADVTSTAGAVFLRAGDDVEIGSGTVSGATRIDIRATAGGIAQTGGALTAPELLAVAQTGISLGVSGTLSATRLQALSAAGSIEIVSVGALELRVLDKKLSHVAVRNDGGPLSVTAGGTLTVSNFLYALDAVTLVGGPSIVVNACLFSSNGPFLLNGTEYPVPGDNADVTFGGEPCFELGLPPAPAPESTGDALLVGDLLRAAAAGETVDAPPLFDGLAPPKMLEGSAGEPGALYWNPRVVVVGMDGVARFWSVETGRLERTLETGRAVRAAAVAPSARLLATAAGGEVTIHSLADGRIVKRLRVDATAAAFSPDGAQLALAGAVGVSIWDTRAWIETAALDAAVTSMAFSADGRRLAGAGADGTARMWDAGTWELARTLSVPGPAAAVAVSGDGALAALGADGTVAVAVATGKGERVFAATRGESIAFSPDGKRVVIGGAEGAFTAWNALTGRAEGSLQAFGAAIRLFAFDRAGSRLAAVSAEGRVGIWSLSR
jgi:filamentous hemagglutinin family protein